MDSNSRLIHSNQKGVHKDLSSTLSKHVKSAYKKPISSHSKKVYNEIIDFSCGNSIILDTGCGIGESTLKLSKLYPDYHIIGIDKSLKRLDKFKTLSDQCRVFYMDLIDFWLLCHEEQNLDIYKQYLLYPNPWPKAHHLKKRWHGHSIFPFLLEISLRHELRTNWGIYADEFENACKLYCNLKGVKNFRILRDSIIMKRNDYLSPFERKYLKSGHNIYSVSLIFEDR